MNIWLDDLRQAPEGWVRTYTVDQTISLLKEGGVDTLSLDHDLGTESDGVDVLKWLEAQDKGEGNDYWPNVVSIHSSNSVGRMNMQRIIEASGYYGYAVQNQSHGKWSGITSYERIK